VLARKMLANAARRSAGDFEEDGGYSPRSPAGAQGRAEAPQVVSLLLVGGYGQIALRDFGLLVGALTLARLASAYSGARPGPEWPVAATSALGRPGGRPAACPIRASVTRSVSGRWQRRSSPSSPGPLASERARCTPTPGRVSRDERVVPMGRLAA
jgi:hypothetical protein